MSESARGQTYDFSGMSALVVDDEPSMREIVKFVLKGMGFTIETASGGREAFSMAQQKPYDLIVSDLRMPDGDGAELLDNIHKQQVKVGVFYFLSAYGDISHDEARKKGASDILSKPIDIKEFRSIIALAMLSHKNT